MRFILHFIFTFGLFCHLRAKVILNFQIYNYRNDENLIHNGGRCESLHDLGDHCDPMFNICITGVHPCDIYKTKLNFWKNKKRLFSVISRNVPLDKFPKKLTIKVKVDDYDSTSQSDHIAVFTSVFEINSINNIYRSLMSVFPHNLRVGLQASVHVKCADNYHGTKCEYMFNENECIETCGQGNCVMDKMNKQYICQCDAGWGGMNCREYFVSNCSLLKCLKSCTYSETMKECVCESAAHNKMYCREIIRTNVETTHKTLKPTISVSTISSKSAFIKILSTEKNKNIVSSTKMKEIKFVTTNSIILPFSEITVSTQTVKSNTSFDNKINNPKPESDKQINRHENVMKPQNSPTMIIIICLLVVLCISVVGLFFIIQHWLRKNKSKLNEFMRTQRPLPPVLYQRDKNPEEPFKVLVQENPVMIRKPDLKSESCMIGYNDNSDKVSQLYLINNEMENNDPYEEPIINNMESLTCETDCNDSDYSDIYEVPIKSKVTK